MFSFFSCDFGIKENEETNSKEYFTVKGSCSIQGAIPSDLFPEKSIKQNAQRTVVPKIEIDEITVSFESETGETKSAEVVDKDGVLNFEIELPLGKWTVKAQGKKSDDVIIESESCQIELPAENKSETVKLVLKPTQSDTKEGTFNFSFGTNYNKVSGMKYTYKKHGATESQSAIIVNFSDPINIELSSGVYTFRFDFYSDTDCIDELLYSFTEVVNIFDGLTTDTWIGAGEYIKEGEICITDNMISQFISTTVYVSENGNDSNLGTFFEPVKTIQNAVNKVIAMNVVTASSEENPYKILLLSDIYTPSNDSFESNNNALVNINPSSASDNPLYLTISKCGDGNATINANRTDSNIGRVMYIGENANVTLKNLTIKGGYLLGANGGGIYSKGNCKLNSCTISGNTAKVLSGSVKGGGVYIESGSFTMEGCTISGNTAGSETSDAYASASANAFGGGIYGESGTKIYMNDTTISENKVASVNDVEGAGVYLSGAELTMQENSKIYGNSCVFGGHASSYGGGVYINNSSTFTMTCGEIFENSAKYGGGVYVSGGKFIMNGGSISNNTVTENGKGKGVYVVKHTNPEGIEFSPTFEISGDASITEDNDVYLANGTTITVTGNLTSTDTVATITPNEYSTTRQVLVAGSGVNLTDKIVNRFLVTQENGNEWYVTVNGNLQNMEKDANGYYLGREPSDKVPSTKIVTTEDGDVVLNKVSCSIESYDNMLWIAHGLKNDTIDIFDIILTNDIEIPSGKWQFNQLNVAEESLIDGQGHSITINEDVSSFGNEAGGLFYKFNNSTVKNLVLKGSITAKTSITVNTTNNTTEVGYIGALCRSAYRTTIQNVMSTVKIIDNGSGNAGGLVGYFGGHNGDERTPDTFIKNCAVYADISSKDGTAGGLVGESWANYQTWKIENCIYMGTVSSDSGVAGALIGNENTGRTSYLTNIWYCESNNCAIFGKEGNKGNITQSGVESKTAEEIATEAAATLLNTNSDGTTNDVWKYIPGSDYPTLKTLSSE